MRRVRLPALMIALLLLAGCGRADGVEQRFEKFRAELMEAQTISFTAEVSENLGSEVFECVLDCTVSGEEICCRVEEPESIAGIVARISGDKAQVEYDGVIMAVPEGGSSPAMMAGELISALRRGHVKTAWSEGGDLPRDVLSFYMDEEHEISIWFIKDTMTPDFAEIHKSGETVLKCRINGFTAEKGLT